MPRDTSDDQTRADGLQTATPATKTLKSTATQRSSASVAPGHVGRRPKSRAGTPRRTVLGRGDDCEDYSSCGPSTLMVGLPLPALTTMS